MRRRTCKLKPVTRLLSAVFFFQKKSWFMYWILMCWMSSCEKILRRSKVGSHISIIFVANTPQSFLKKEVMFQKKGDKNNNKNRAGGKREPWPIILLWHVRVHPFENLEIMLVCLENDFPQLDEVLDLHVNKKWWKKET